MTNAFVDFGPSDLIKVMQDFMPEQKLNPKTSLVAWARLEHLFSLV